MNITPSSAKERILTIDIIRGFALLGIILANMAYFKSPVLQKTGLLYETAPLPDQALDIFAVVFTDTFVLGKFYPMFSLLFGLGFYLFYERLIQKDLDGKQFYKRRLVFLLVIGFIHLVFIWSGDILVTYALGGFLLLLFINRTPKFILTWGILLIAGLSVVMTGLVVLGNFFLQMDAVSEFQAGTSQAVSEAYTVMSQGSYTEILAFRFTSEIILILGNLPISVLNVFGIFLIGLYFGKQGWFRNVGEHLAGWKKIRLHAGWSGILLTALFAALKFDVTGLPFWMADGLAQGLNLIAGPLLMLFYVSVMVLLLHGKAPGLISTSLAAVGKMALTNYLMQSIICVLIFFGFGFGLYGSVGAFTGMVLAILIYFAQIVFSRVWLTRFNQGPMEALWRKWTYKKAS
ncbi:DUF418 domain-containing protein [Alkalicoccus halolimnae]|uniref:DUF418 domain-containing protein n=1 Tax=Alkalicoccus halolimnae TaxID=1667239 RepID=A0A5C7F3H0_9BACI|nr:DUF418 domain-containing protein [Alkalicoccus halolimnae]TXF82717.1 DUF418 domain-containing protein [Alkalicoccus halolimnae]